ncbi:MAG: 2,5-diamino-6-(ribosylamino)-4(3H)-pyrimidinone 5'-phosphate reductase [Thelocarpon impressellum]|nr:MAG: 2,5-diamino-6-(ribosylamino)-4(3H)-pyrimidinone 5'-phosphate reductase [Thelocarpon impressellum]
MTHHLRAHHAAILVGAGTAIADDPGLNCRLQHPLDRQPRPIILDQRARWAFSRDARVLATARSGRGLAPWILVAADTTYPAARLACLEEAGGKLIRLPLPPSPSPSSSPASTTSRRFPWPTILSALAAHGLTSVMIEGGGAVIADLLAPPNLRLVRSVVVTLAPVLLGRGCVLASPDARRGADAEGEAGLVPAVRFTDVLWTGLGEDVVFCGRPA